MKIQHLARLWTIILITTMLIAGFGSITNIANNTSVPNSSNNEGEQKLVSGPSNRTVLAESFTADWCVYCPTQAHSMERLVNEYGEDRLVFLEYHSASDDEFYNSDSGNKANYYNIPGYPTVIFDGGGYYWSEGEAEEGGTLWESGGSSKYARYEDDKEDIELELAEKANMTISLTGDINATMGYVKAHIEITETITETNLKVRFVVYENNLYHLDANTNESNAHHRVYSYIVRDVLPDEDLTITNVGETQDFEKSFTIDPSWYPNTDIRRLGIAVFVQTDNKIAWKDWTIYPYLYEWRYNGPVFQAASYDFVPQSILVVDGDNTDTNDDAFDHYDEELTKIGVSHDNWDTLEPGDNNAQNLRTMPTYEEMSPYSAVIWFTNDATSTLSSADRENISAYLDNIGNLFISGEDIGNDANTNGWISWYQNYLHANFVNDNSGDTLVDGVPGDPIGDGLVDLSVTGTSPSIVDPADGSASTPFKYDPSGSNAAVKADHDTDSRTVYFAFNFFEGADTADADIDDETLLNRILSWLDGSSLPNVTVIQPNGNEVLTPDETYEIQWDAKDVNMTETPIDIYYCNNSASPDWILISSGEPNDGIYNWTVPSEESSKCRVKVVATDSQNQIGEDISDDDFTIGTGDLSVEPPTNIWAELTGTNLENVTITWTKSTDDGGGENDVTGYDIYYNQTYDKNKTGYTLLSSLGPGNTSYVHVNDGLNTTNSFYYIVAKDSNSNTAATDDQAGKFVKELPSGRQLISIPVVQSDTTLTTVLQTIEGSYNYVQWYNATDATDHWKTYSIDKPSGFNDLLNVNHKMALWITMISPDNLTVAGKVPKNTTIQLYKGYNFVSYASFINRTVNDALSSIPYEKVEGFDDSAPPYYLKMLVGTDWMEAGNGYWIYVTSDCAWMVEN